MTTYKIPANSKYAVDASPTSIGQLIDSGQVEPSELTIPDFDYAIEWLCIYDADEEDFRRQAFTNIIAFLEAEVAKRQKRSALNEAKREYAQANKIPFRQVRVTKG